MILIFMPESSYPCYPVSGAAGSSDTEGKAAKGSGETRWEPSEFQIRGFRYFVRLYSSLFVVND